MKKLILLFISILLTSCVFLGKQFFLAKNPGFYYYSAIDIINSEIYIKKHGWDKFYFAIENNNDIPDYIDVLPQKDNTRVIGRFGINKEEFHHYIKNILPNLENSEFYKRYDRNKVYDRDKVIIFRYGLANMLATVEDIKGKIQIIRIEDDKAYIKFP